MTDEDVQLEFYRPEGSEQLVLSLQEDLELTIPIAHALKGEQGIPGIQGPPGLPGISGDGSQLGGIPVNFGNLQEGDLIVYSAGNWENEANLTLTDGGNF